MIIIDVLGTPAPKGSSRAFLNKRTGRAILAPGGSKTNQDKIKGWSAAVREAAADSIGERVDPVYVDRCLVVVIEFKLARPTGHWHPTKGGLKPSAPAAPRTKPDIDKLARTTLDSLTGLAFDDDSRIVDLVTRKRYAEPGKEGARITVEEWKP